MGQGLVKDTVPFPCTNGAGAIVAELVASRCPASGAVAWGGLSWVLKVRIRTKRLYEARLLSGEGNPAKRHPWGQ